MGKPPESPPHSDLDGVREDEEPVIDSANEAGQDAGDLKTARDQSIARPRPSD